MAAAACMKIREREAKGMLERIASRLGKNDETPNIELAAELARAGDRAGIEEIVSGLGMDRAAASDCIKVLYEIGERRPELIAPYAESFIRLLGSRENRLVWGAMTALGQVAGLNPDLLYAHLDEVRSAYETGSVITVDHSIEVFARLCAAKEVYEERVLPVLLSHLASCRAKEIPQHLERMAVCFRPGNAEAFRAAVNARYGELSKPQKARVDRVLKKLPGTL